jgi:hypothetical protein
MPDCRAASSSSSTVPGRAADDSRSRRDTRNDRHTATLTSSAVRTHRVPDPQPRRHRRLPRQGSRREVSQHRDHSHGMLTSISPAIGSRGVDLDGQGGQAPFEHVRGSGSAAFRGEPARVRARSGAHGLQRCRTPHLAHHDARHLPLLAQRHTRRGRPHQIGKHVLLPPLDIMQKLAYRFSGAASSPVGDRAPTCPPQATKTDTVQKSLPEHRCLRSRRHVESEAAAP